MMIKKKWIDPITKRQMAVGLCGDGYRFEMVSYGETTHVALMMSVGNWVQFFEPATIEEMLIRFESAHTVAKKMEEVQ